MLRLLLTTDVMTIKRHIENHKRRNGPQVVARIQGMAGTPQILDVRKEAHAPGKPRLEQQFLRQMMGQPLLPDPPKRLEVQLQPYQPWHIAQAIYLKSDDDE